MQDYRVELDAYSGPLDLLLYLVRRHEIDLHDIPVATLTDQYLAHLEVIKHIDVDLAGEFLVMAATLLEVKSAMLVPAAEAADDDQAADASLSDLDPRHELVQQLLAYKQFKDAAFDLEDRQADWANRFAAVPGRPDRGGDQNAEMIELDLDDANIMDLCEAFGRILQSIGQGPATHDVTYDDTPIGLHADDIVDRLQREGTMSLQRIFIGRTNRSEMIGLFLATLELVRQRRILVLQPDPAQPIRLELRDDVPPSETDSAETDWRDPRTGEMQYDWPSEEARLRAQRRAERRAKSPFAKKDTDTDSDSDETEDEPVMVD